MKGVDFTRKPHGPSASGSWPAERRQVCYGVFVLEWGCMGALGRIPEFESVNQTIILLLPILRLLYYYYERKNNKKKTCILLE